MKAIVAILVILCTMMGYAQSPETMRKIENARIALITDRLDLTPEQAQQFWPIYNEYSKRQREIRADFNAARREFNPQTASEEENQRLLEMGLKVKENQLNLDREYSERLQTVITNRQIVTLRKAEDDFKQMLIDRMREYNRQQERGRRQNNARMNQRGRN